MLNENREFYYKRYQIGFEAMSNPTTISFVGWEHLLFPEMVWGTDLSEEKRGRRVECLEG